MSGIGRADGGCVSKLQLVAAFASPLSLLAVVLLLPWPKLSWRPCQCQCQSSVSASPEELGFLESAQSGSSDVEWLHHQLQPLSPALAGARDGAWLAPRKGINPRTRQQQLFDIRRFHGISHYENGSGLVECPGELLVEPHHSYYGEPWAGGRDVYEFLAAAVSLRPQHRVLEIGCGTLRVGVHFIRFLAPSNFYCWERDALSLAAALLYELPANGLLRKRPSLLLGDDLRTASELLLLLLQGPPFDLVYASAVFLHMPDAVVWDTVEVLGLRLAVPHGRLFVSHNIKFCTRLSWRACEARLWKVGLQHVGKQTHDSLLFNHFEVWHEFRRRSFQPP